MKNTLLLASTSLHHLNAFDVGNNPEHINYGAIKHELINTVNAHKEKIELTDFITTNGFTLDMLYEEAPEILEQLQQLTKETHIEIIGVPYYNTKLQLLSPSQLQEQWQLTVEACQKHLGVTPKKIYVGNQSIPKHLSETILGMGAHIIGDASLHVATINLGYDGYAHTDESVGYHSPFVAPTKQNELLEQITTELLALEPYLSHDEQLYTTWKLMGQDHVLNKLTGEQPQVTYDTYFTMMNILNDVAHTIRNVELTKRGEFETTAQIVDQPSRRVLDVVENR